MSKLTDSPIEREGEVTPMPDDEQDAIVEDMYDHGNGDTLRMTRYRRRGRI
jgi:hypothetical protein